jgi:hypothetical protein
MEQTDHQSKGSAALAVTWKLGGPTTERTDGFNNEADGLTCSSSRSSPDATGYVAHAAHAT